MNNIGYKRDSIIAQGIAEQFQKGKPAQYGEVREWQGKKYRKQPNGKWVEIGDDTKRREEREESEERGGAYKNYMRRHYLK